MLFAIDKTNEIKSAEGSSKSVSNLLEESRMKASLGTHPSPLLSQKLTVLHWEATAPRGVTVRLTEPNECQVPTLALGIHKGSVNGRKRTGNKKLSWKSTGRMSEGTGNQILVSRYLDRLLGKCLGMLLSSIYQAHLWFFYLVSYDTNHQHHLIGWSWASIQVELTWYFMPKCYQDKAWSFQSGWQIIKWKY